METANIIPDFTNEPLVIVTGDVPETQRDNIAAAVLDGVLTFFESAANRAKYEAWLAARKQRKALLDIGQCK